LIDRYDVGETPVINTEANQSSSSEEPGFFTKLGNKIAELNKYNINEATNPFETGTPYTTN